MRRAAAPLIVLAVLAACGGSPPAGTSRDTTGRAAPRATTVSEFPSSTPPSSTPPTPAQPADGQGSAAPAAPAPWVVGASPLPLRPDGFGQVLPTPEVLRDRAMTAADILPPPPDGAFTSSVAGISPQVRARMGETWSPACPVALGDLRYVTVAFRGFDGAPHTGELVVAASVADDVVSVFRQLYAADFPIEQMRLIGDADLGIPPTGDGNNTASYMCRAARGQTTWSQHAYGLAIDVNPFHNPMAKGDLVLPELAGAYADRTVLRPGMHALDGPAVRAFAGIGWQWGGDWRSSKDWMHFSRNGR
jgi:hypothetical protein